MRDRGTQVTPGTFVATIAYALVVLIEIGTGDRGDFLRHLSVIVAIGLVLVDLCVPIYLIHHVATGIPLPTVIASIALDLSDAIDVEAARTP